MVITKRQKWNSEMKQTGKVMNWNRETMGKWKIEIYFVILFFRFLVSFFRLLVSLFQFIILLFRFAGK